MAPGAQAPRGRTRARVREARARPAPVRTPVDRAKRNGQGAPASSTRPFRQLHSEGNHNHTNPSRKHQAEPLGSAAWDERISRRAGEKAEASRRTNHPEHHREASKQCLRLNVACTWNIGQPGPLSPLPHPAEHHAASSLLTRRKRSALEATGCVLARSPRFRAQSHGVKGTERRLAASAVAKRVVRQRH